MKIPPQAGTGTLRHARAPRSSPRSQFFLFAGSACVAAADRDSFIYHNEVPAEAYRRFFS
jgi:hypothetical protein